MASREFPQITPSSRTYRPGRQPETVFQAQNGATTVIAFGSRFVDAELDMEFRNITDEVANQILEHYQTVRGDDYVVFGENRGLGGISENLRNSMQTGRDILRYRYKQPPEIQSVYPGVSTVRVSFIGILYGV